MDATLSEWKDFLESNVFKDMVGEIEARKGVITPLLVAGNDPQWSDDNMRGRLDELNFLESMVTDIISAIELEENKGSSEDESFMGRLFKNWQNKGD